MTDRIEAQSSPAEGAAYWWALRVSAVSLAALAAVGGIVAGLARGSGGLWGALAGAGLAALAALVTQGAMVMGYRKAPHVFASIVGGSWLAKMVVIVGGMLALSSVASIDRASFGIVALAGIIGTLLIDLLAVRKARIPYANPKSKSPES
ncbi:MAG: hypothetical protein HGA51_09580 [Demequinaceae bacterium]|nr:hypothetical protein [Demequinaceae bacterium]